MVKWLNSPFPYSLSFWENRVILGSNPVSNLPLITKVNKTTCQAHSLWRSLSPNVRSVRIMVKWLNSLVPDSLSFWENRLFIIVNLYLLYSLIWCVFNIYSGCYELLITYSIMHCNLKGWHFFVWFSVTGERLSPWVAFGCFTMGVSIIFFWVPSCMYSDATFIFISCNKKFTPWNLILLNGLCDENTVNHCFKT